MTDFIYRNGVLYCESMSLVEVAEKVGTPCYVYSSHTVRRQCDLFKRAFASYPTLACYAVKANSNLTLLKEIFDSGMGAEVVSGGELDSSLRAGARNDQIIYSGVGKTAAEIARALELGILSIHVESADELALIARLAAERDKVVPISLRINPDIDAKTNPHIATGLYTTKFGFSEREAKGLVRDISPSKNLRLVGLSCHIGSQITSVSPFEEVARRMRGLAKEFLSQGFHLQLLDLGGGLGIRYQDENPPSFESYAAALLKEMAGSGLRLLLEPGRVLVGNSAILLTKILSVKQSPTHRFVVVDAGMNDLIRPSLYDAYHEIQPVLRPEGSDPTVTVDVVGPLCETADFLGKRRELPRVNVGDLLCIYSCGAYGYSMASNYNSRPRAPEIWVQDSGYKIIRRRETVEDLWSLELPISCA